MKTVKEFACLKKMGDALVLLRQVEEALEGCDEIFNQELILVSKKVSEARFGLEQLVQKKILASPEVQKAEASVDIRDGDDLKRVVSETHILPP